MTCVNTRRRNTRGFTLIELVVAITILGLFAAVVSSALRTGVRAWSRGNAELDDIRSSQTKLSVLRAQINGALPIIFTQSDRQGRLLFAGDARSLRLVSRASFRDGPEAAPRWIEYAWNTVQGSGRLHVKESRVDPTEMTPGADLLWQGDVLDGTAFRFEYLTRRTADTKPEWRDSWVESNLQMPAAIRISITRRGHAQQMVLPLDYAENSWSGGWFF